MADLVQQVLEEMIPELEELQINGIFTQSEIKAIVKKRKEHEYNTRRAGKELVDFMRYIEYELNLGFIIKQRAARANVKSKTYFATIQRVHVIFNRALTKFKGNIKLWLQYIDYAMLANSGKVLSKIFVDCIRFHPTYVPFWILSASWEYTENDNIISARAILQRANRINPKSKEILFEYCRLELMYRDKVMKRLDVLNIEKEVVLQKLKDSAPNEDSIVESDLPDTDENGEGIVSETKNLFFEGAIPLTIYKFGIATFPKDLRLREKYIALFSGFDNTEDMLTSIYEGIETDFPESMEAKVLVMRKEYDLLKNEENLFNVVLEVLGRFEIYEMEHPEDISIQEELKRFMEEVLQEETDKKCRNNNFDSDLVSFLEKKLSA